MSKIEVANNLPKKIESLFILDDESKFLFTFKTGSDVILSENDMHKLVHNKANLKAIVILAELDWSSKYLQHFYGFDLAGELRRKYKVLCPIIITSSLGGSYFENLALTNVKYNMLYGRGIAFLSLNELNEVLYPTIEKLQKYPLTDAVLSDMNEMLLDQKGIVIDKLTHDLKYGISQAKLNAIMTESGAYLDSRQKASINWDDFKELLTENIENEDTLNKIADELIKKCDRELIGNLKPTEAFSGKKLKILVLEDDLDFQKKIKENLTDYFEGLLITANAVEAIQKLEGDGTNSILGIISDWRLYVDHTKKTYWQLQGYEVLQHAARTKFVALFALTSLSDRNVHSIRNLLGLDIHLFKKQHLENTDSKIQWEMMADTVKQKCNEIIDVIASDKNMGEGWSKSEERNKQGEVIIAYTALREQYILKRNFQWKIFEESISKQTDLIWKYYGTSLAPQSNKLLEGIAKKWNLQFEKSGTPLLENILIVRRIWLSLWYNNSKLDFNINRNELPEVKICCVLRQQYFDDLVELERQQINSGKEKITAKKKFKGKETEKSVEEDVEDKLIQNSKNLLNKLCIIPSSLPRGILPEERNWLLRNGISVIEGNDVFDNQSNIDKEDANEEEYTKEFDPTSERGREKINEMDLDIINENSEFDDKAE